MVGSGTSDARRAARPPGARDGTGPAPWSARARARASRLAAVATAARTVFSRPHHAAARIIPRAAALLLALAPGVSGQIEDLDPMSSLEELLQAAADLGAPRLDGTGLPPDALPDVSAPEAVALPPATPIGEGENTGFESVGPERLEFHARNIDVAEAFAQLRRIIRRNIVVDPAVRARFTGDLYDLDLHEVLDVVTASAGLTWREDGDVVYIEPTGLQTRVFRLHHVRATDLVPIVQPLLGADGRVAATIEAIAGIPSSQEEAGGDSYAHAEVLVVRETPAVLDEIATIVEAVDGQPQQVLVEATILIAELNDEFELGIQLAGLSGVDFVGSGTTSAGGGPPAFGTIPGSELDEGVESLKTAVNSGLSSAGLTVGWFKNGVSAFLEAVSAVTRTTVLASPKLITVNKQRGEVLLGRRDGYRTLSVSQTSTTEEIEFLETGTRLIFRPFVTPEGWVRLEVHAEDSDGGINDEGLPFKDTAESTTNVFVRSGETVVIGGLFRERTRTVETKVPLVGDIPLLGWLFKSTDEQTIREEIVVLLTPHVLELTSAEDSQAAAAAGRADPFEGLLPTSVDGRALAARYVDTADALAARGRLGSARVLLQAAESLGHPADDIGRRTTRLWRRLVPPATAATVDRRILDRIAQLVERP